jgi:glycosyltransferase involved in cell wall biosynthesis
MKAPLVVHFHGSETRMGYGLYRPHLIDAKIVATPDLLEYHPGATYIPIPQEPLPYHYEFSGRVKVIHAPTNRKFKGTDLILKAIEQAQSEGLDFDFELIELIPHEQMLEKFRHNHIYIDRVIADVEGKLIGTMGVAPLEAMSIGNAVLMHLNDQYLHYYEGCPVVNVQPTVESVVAGLRRLIEDPEQIRRLGLIGSRYVKETRDPKRIGQQCVEVYETVLRR